MSNFRGAVQLVSYLDSISQYQPLSREREVALARRSLQGDKAARNELACSCLKLVVRIASKFDTKRLPLSDLIQAGNESLIHAAVRYDPDEYPGVRFSTYAGQAIQHGIIAELGEEQDGFTVSSWVRDNRKLVWDAAEKFLNEHHREPTDKELVELTGLSPKSIQSVKDSLRGVTSLDAYPTDEEGLSLGDTLADDRVCVEYEALTNAMLDEVMDLMTVLLTPKERVAVSLRYGLGLLHGRTHSYEEIGKALGCVREQARQYELSGLAKLRKAYEGGKSEANGLRQILLWGDMIECAA